MTVCGGHYDTNPNRSWFSLWACEFAIYRRLWVENGTLFHFDINNDSCANSGMKNPDWKRSNPRQNTLGPFPLRVTFHGFFEILLLAHHLNYYWPSNLAIRFGSKLYPVGYTPRKHFSKIHFMLWYRKENDSWNTREDLVYCLLCNVSVHSNLMGSFSICRYHMTWSFLQIQILLLTLTLTIPYDLIQMQILLCAGIRFSLSLEMDNQDWLFPNHHASRLSIK